MTVPGPRRWRCSQAGPWGCVAAGHPARDLYPLAGCFNPPATHAHNGDAATLTPPHYRSAPLSPSEERGMCRSSRFCVAGRWVAFQSLRGLRGGGAALSRDSVPFMGISIPETTHAAIRLIPHNAPVRAGGHCALHGYIDALHGYSMPFMGSGCPPGYFVAGGHSAEGFNPSVSHADHAPPVGASVSTSGSRKIKVLPCPTVEIAMSEPPCACASSRAM